MRPYAFEMGALEASDKARLAEMHDFDAARRAVIKLLEGVPVLGSEAVGVKAKTGERRMCHRAMLQPAVEQRGASGEESRSAERGARSQTREARSVLNEI